MFKSTAKPMGGLSVVWDENDDRIAKGESKYFGERIVGKYMEAMVPIKKGAKTFFPYRLKLYADFNDESKFGQEPDGEEVTVWGGAVINSSFERGSDGSGIKVGDIVEIVYLGERETVDKANTYPNFAIGAFTPKPTFNSTAPATNSVGAAPKVGTSTRPVAKPAANKSALSDLGY